MLCIPVYYEIFVYCPELHGEMFIIRWSVYVEWWLC